MRNKVLLSLFTLLLLYLSSEKEAVIDDKEYEKKFQAEARAYRYGIACLSQFKTS